MEILNKKCLIQQEEIIPEFEQSVLKKYWPFNGEKFKTTPAQVAKHFNLNSAQLFKIIATYTEVFVYDHCSTCGLEMVTAVDCQIDFLEAYHNDGNCDNCLDKIAANHQGTQLIQST